MTNEERKLIFDYCHWDYWAWGMKDFTGNDILEAVQIMEERGDWLKFTSSVELRCYQYIKLTPSEFPYLLQNFFPLMVAWLKERGK